jgi:hypothetical protein
MNDARWLRYWIAQHVKAPLLDEAATKALAIKAERAAARDGFSVDDALRETGCDTFQSFLLKILQDRTERT